MTRKYGKNNIEILRCNSEKIIIKMERFILKENPDYVTGYNIFGFDFDYIIKNMSVLFKCRGVMSVNGKLSCGMRKHQFYRLGRMMKDNVNDHESSIDLKNLS